MKISKTFHFDKDGFSGDVYVDGELKKGFNALRVDVHGKHPLKKMIDTIRVYYVVEGTGKFAVNGEWHEAAKDDLFVVEPGSTYEYEGMMKLFEFNVSPDNSFKDEVL